jgi:hypothetical protein
MVAALLAAGQALAADPVLTPAPMGAYLPYGQGTVVQGPSTGASPRPSTPQMPGTPSTTPPSTTTPSTTPSLTPSDTTGTGADAFAQGSPAGGQSSSYTPGVIGDLNSGGYFTKNVFLISPSVSSSSSSFGSSNFFTATASSAHVKLPIVTRIGVKIGENNESPMPMDRVTLGYNFYSNTKIDGGASPVNGFDTHVEMFSFEKTFMDGNASIGARLPFTQLPGETALGLNGIGDLTLISKFALLNDRSSGSVLSGGLAVTVPTGRNLHPIDNFGNNISGDLRTVLLQPYVGFIFNCEDFYVQGFSSAILPTDFQDNVYLANSVVGGYRLYQSNSSQCLNYLIPVVEAHVTTPLNNRGLGSAPISFTDVFVTTVGMHVGLYNCAQMTIGAATPLTGPRPFDWEGVVQLTLRF